MLAGKCRQREHVDEGVTGWGLEQAWKETSVLPKLWHLDDFNSQVILRIRAIGCWGEGGGGIPWEVRNIGVQRHCKHH